MTDLEMIAWLLNLLDDGGFSPLPWGEDDCNVFSEPITNARHDAIMRKLNGEQLAPHQEGFQDLDGFVATTEQRHETSWVDSELIVAAVNALPRLVALAETGALLAEVEAKWPHPRYDIEISRNEEPGPEWAVSVVDYAEEYGSGEGPTLTAALRDLLGVDGG